MKLEPAFVASVARAVGLPPVRSARIQAWGLVRTFELGFDQLPPVWLRVPLPSVGAPALRMERAIVGHMRSTGLKSAMPDPYTILEVDGQTVAVMPRPAGQEATERLGTDASGVARAIGAWLARVPAAHTQHATAAHGAHLVREHATWRAAVEAELRRVRAGLARLGFGLGAVEERLAGYVHAGLPAMDAVRAFGVVHRTLSPDRVWLDGDEVVAVVDWSSAWVGDPLLQWGPLAVQPPAVLGAMLVGAGLDPRPELVRLQAYAALAVLCRLEDRVRATPEPAGAAVASCLAVEEARAVDDLPDRVDQALEPGDGVWPGWRPDPVAQVLRGALHRLATDGDRLDERLEHTLAAALLADHPDAPAPEALIAHAARLLAALPSTGPVAVGLPGDPLARALTAPGPSASAARTAWLVQRAIARVGPVDPSVHAALALRVEAALADDERPLVAEPHVVLRYALLAAVASVGTPEQPTWIGRLAEEWEAAEMPIPAGAPEPRALLTAPLEDSSLGPALLALLQLPDDALPAPASAMSAAIRSPK